MGIPAGVVNMSIIVYSLTRQDVWRGRWKATRGVSAGFHKILFSLLTQMSVLWLRALDLPCVWNMTFVFRFHLARWTAADLITAYCVHTHKPISTLQDKQQMRILLCGAIVIQVNFRTHTNGTTRHRWKERTWTVLFLWTMCRSALRHANPEDTSEAEGVSFDPSLGSSCSACLQCGTCSTAAEH